MRLGKVLAVLDALGCHLEVTAPPEAAGSGPAFAEDIGLAASFVRRRVRELSDAVGSQVSSLPNNAALADLDLSALKEHAALIASRAERLARIAKLMTGINLYPFIWSVADSLRGDIVNSTLVSQCH